MIQHSCESKTDWFQIELDSCSDESIPLGRSFCEKPCPFIYFPVCGHNGKISKIFPNQCVMDVENCYLEEKFVITKLADCFNVVPA
ncbi:U-Kazal-Dg21.2-like [Condylostylus longicornis]|uniref:U-Kazal-Dg21.2-like n=1 Tax=Condylostylus longicornis TaxID=2530218 RepID=UPI00244DDB0A|nr:U-Kazal-Dg21.2-like [Condylostylus longicornis]